MIFVHNRKCCCLKWYLRMKQKGECTVIPNVSSRVSINSYPFPLVLTPYHTCTKRLANVRTRLHRCSKWNPGLTRWPDPKGMSLKIIALQVCSYDDHHVSRTFKIRRNNLGSSICTLVRLL